jgi:hypothetical protein
MSIAITTMAALAMLAGGEQRGPQNDQRVSPRGSYAQSCSGSYVNQGRLYADCRDTRGNVRGSSIELNRCSSSDIGNDNGLLVCNNVRGRWEDRGGNNNGGGWNGGGNNGGNNGGGWNGGGNNRGSITVYRDANYRGQSTSFRGEVSNLSNSGFNDAISSMELNGAWEVCTDANFRGNCQIIDSSVRNLDRWGLNDRISSLRPAGRGGGRW